MSNNQYTFKPILVAIYVLLTEITLLLKRPLKWIFNKFSRSISKVYMTFRRFFFHVVIAVMAFHAGAIYNDIYEHYRFYIFRTGSGDKRHQVPLPRKVQIEQSHDIYDERKKVI